MSQSYSILDAAELLRRTPPTIRSWIKQGLPTLPGTSPRLICGGELKEWLTKRANARKQPCGVDKLYCVKCRSPSRPKPETVGTSPISAKTVKVSGKCSACNTTMQQPRALIDLAATIKAMTAPTQHQLNITGYTNSPVNSTFWPDEDAAIISAQNEGKPNVH